MDQLIQRAVSGCARGRGQPVSSSSGFSTTRVSVVSSSEAMDAALASADRVTLTGSRTPAPSRSPYSPVAALKPLPGAISATLEVTT